MFFQLSTPRKLKTATSKLKMLKTSVSGLFTPSSFKDTEWKHVLKNRGMRFFRRENSRQGDYLSSSFLLPHMYSASFFQFAWATRVKGQVKQYQKIPDNYTENIHLHLRKVIREQCRIQGRGSPRCTRLPGGLAAQRPRQTCSQSLTHQASVSQ